MSLLDISALKLTLNVGQQVTGVVVSGGPGGAGVVDEYRSGQRAPSELSIPSRDLQPGADIFSMLDWHTTISDFAGRDAELRALREWAEDDLEISARFIVGEGGVGKSRLAAEFGVTLRDDGWAAGFVNLREPNGYFTKAAGTLLIVDYPEENRDAVSVLLEGLAQSEPVSRIRLLFLTRRSVDDWRNILHDSRAANIFDFESVLHLGPLSGGDAHRVYNSALKRAAQQFGTAPPPLPRDALDAWLAHAPENDRALFIIATAIHSAIHPDSIVVEFSGREVVTGLVKRELTRLRGISTDLGLKENCLAQVLALSAVADGLDTARVRELAASDLDLDLPEPGGVGPFLRDSALLSDGEIPAPRPDILAASLVVEVFGRNPDMAPEWLWAAMGEDVAGGLGRLARLVHDAEYVLGLLDHRLSEWLAEAVGKKAERCRGIEARLRDANLELGLLSAAVSVWRILLDDADDDFRRGDLWNNLCNHLYDLGEREQALEAAQESVNYIRRLATDDPGNYETNLASSLNSLSIQLSETGDAVGALAAIRDAVEIRRRLARADPARFEPELALNLTNLSNWLSETGNAAGALAAIRDAVEIYRRLAQADPARFEHELAASLNNLSGCLSETSDAAGPLAAIRDAVDIRRRLARADPARFEPDLAASLNNLSNRLSEAGDKPGALAAIRKAVVIDRRLARASPARFEPELASSLNNLSNRLSETGDAAGALAAIRDAMAIYRRLAQANPARFEPGLAGSLNNLSNRLSEAGDEPGALEAIRDAVEIRRRLAQANPARFEPDLAQSLNNLSGCLSETSDAAGPLAAIRDAVDIRRRLARADPARFEPDLAASLNNLSNRLSEAGDKPGALAAIRESVEIRRRLARANPARFEPDLASSLNNLSKRLSEAGDAAGALAAIRDAVELIRPYAARFPGSTHGRWLEMMERNLRELSD